MKTHIMTWQLIIAVAACKAAKFPILSKHDDETRREEIIPISASFQGGNVGTSDCVFCNDFMLEDCICEDVTFCKSQSCYVPEKCNAKKCDKNVDAEVPNEEELIPVLTEEIVPMTNTLHSELRSELCQYCQRMLEDCNCEDVNWCREEQCSVMPQCTKKCPLEEATTV